MGTRRIRSFSLVVIGAVGGILLSLGISAVAQRGEPLPLKELQQFANVFAAIKASYVEPIGDKKLINDAIKGLFDDLDPHSAYLDADAFKEMEAITQGGFGGLGIEIGSRQPQAARGARLAALCETQDMRELVRQFVQRTQRRGLFLPRRQEMPATRIGGWRK